MKKSNDMPDSITTIITTIAVVGETTTTTTTTTTICEGASTTTSTTQEYTGNSYYPFPSATGKIFTDNSGKMAAQIFESHEAMRKIATDAGVSHERICSRFDSMRCDQEYANNEWKRPGGVYLSYNEEKHGYTPAERYTDYIDSTKRKWADIGASIDRVVESGSINRFNGNISRHVIRGLVGYRNRDHLDSI